MHYHLFHVVTVISLVSSQGGPINNADQNSMQDSNCLDSESCSSDTKKCVNNLCDCNNSEGYLYNVNTKTCEFNLKYLLSTLKEKHNSEEELRIESLRVFRGILISVILFAACASIGLASACIYCCRIVYTDEKLKKTIKKINKTNGQKSIRSHKPALSPIEESCNVVVGDAGVFVA